MARDEFSSKNGTLSINQQTISQREKIGQRFNVDNKILGVGSSNASSLFSNSPIGFESESLPDRTGGRGGLYQEGVNVYEAFSKVIDNPTQTLGYGFSRTEHAYMDYNHPDNPFKEGNYDTLTTGEVNEDIKAYKGFPDLNVNKDSINNPSLNQDQPPESNISELPDGATYGYTTEEYRVATNELASLLGRHIDGASQGNGDIDNLGKYFTKNYVEGGQ